MKNNRKLYFIVFALLLVFIILLFISNHFFLSNSKEIDFSAIKRLEKENKTGLVYVFSSNKKECLTCMQIKKYLDKNHIHYFMYDIIRVDEEEYISFLRYMHIDKKLFMLPALIYIKDGERQYYIMNIQNDEQLHKYIQDYELETIKH